MAEAAKIRFIEGTTPDTTPDTGEWYVYFKSDGLYIMDDAEVETNISQGSTLDITSLQTDQLILDDGSELTIATGAITVTTARHTIDTESDAASDDLDTISGMAAGEFAILSANNTARDVVFKDGVDNIICATGSDITLDETYKLVLAISLDGTNVTVAPLFSTGGGGGGSAAVSGFPADGRLTLTSATPVLTSDVTAATTLYYTPYIGSHIALYDGADWSIETFTERSISVPATTDTNYDVFLYDNSGTLTLELVAWTNDTTRATTLAYQDGVLVKSGDATRRYLGSFRTSSSSGDVHMVFNSTSTSPKILVWNYYNRIDFNLRRAENTDSWTYASATWRYANNSSSNRIEAIIGVPEDGVKISVLSTSSKSSGSAQRAAIGYDSSSAPDQSGGSLGSLASVGIGVNLLDAFWAGTPAIGYHYWSFIESSADANTATFYGDAGGTEFISGMIGSIKA